MQIKKIHTTMNEEQYNLIKESANREGLCLGSYIRRVALLHSKKDEGEQ